MTVRAVEGKKPYTGGKGIEIDENKVISLRLRDENNLIIWDEGDNEIYVDLQLDDEIRPTDAFPVGITTGRVIIDNGWDKTGTLICAKTTSGDNIKIFYSDDGHLYVDHGTGLFTQVYLKPEVDALLSDLRTYIDTELAKKQDKLIAGDNIEIAQDGKTISAILPPLNRFLSLWDCSTGMPISFPTSTLPFEYESGDHFLVETVDSTTNYRPSGTEYDGTASQTVETADVQPGDVYIYDGTTWLLQINHDKTVSFAQIAGQPSDNTNLAAALNAKQDTLTAGNGISIDASDEISVDTLVVATQTDLSNGLANKQDTLTAGQNINIDQNNEISAIDTTYNAGEGIEIGTAQDYSAMQGPAPSGFHVPLSSEWVAVKNIWTALGGGSSDGINFGIALKLPLAGYRGYSNANVYDQGTSGRYWSSSQDSYDGNNAYYLAFKSSILYANSSFYWTFGHSVRCFKNSSVVPTSSWIKLYGTSIESGGIFWSSTDGLISLSSDGQTWITIADKNLGATTVWNNGDTLSEANCGKYYQRGNNYGFPRASNATITTSSTQVDASNYGPGNYYSSSTYIGYRGAWDVTVNGNLWGGVTGVVTLDNAITNTGVLSVNGQTGDVTIQTGGTYTAGNGISIDANNEISVDNTIARVTDVNTKTFYLSSASDLTTAQAAYDWYVAGKNPIIIFNDNAYILSGKNASSQTVELIFRKATNDYSDYQNGTSSIRNLDLKLTVASGSVTQIKNQASNICYILRTGYDYPTPYTPQYNGSPATKKYVDDNVVQKSATAPSSPTEGMVWYDTTNDELKIYDGSAWNAVGGGGDVGVSTQANNVFTPGMKIWGGTSANYANLTPDGNTAYLII